VRGRKQMTKETEENEKRFTIAEVGNSFGVVVWRMVGGAWVFIRGGFDTMEEAEEFCRR
jgi:hypothetical protein